MAGSQFSDQNIVQAHVPNYYSVKESVFPFVKFPDVDPLLGPEMKSTGEVMGVGRSFGEAFAKSLLACGTQLPHSGLVFISVRDVDKGAAIDIARHLLELGFQLIATRGTAQALQEAGLPCEVVNKVLEGRPHIVDRIKNDDIHFIINTTEGQQAIADSYTIRRTALQHKVTYSTTIAGAHATVLALQTSALHEVNRLQDLHQELQGISL